MVHMGDEVNPSTKRIYLSMKYIFVLIIFIYLFWDKLLISFRGEL